MSNRVNKIGFSFIGFFGLLIISGLIFSIFYKKTTISNYTINHAFIHSRFQGNGLNYTFMAQNEKEIFFINTEAFKSYRIIADVESGKPMWAEITMIEHCIDPTIFYLVVHIRSTADIEEGAK